MKSGSSVASLLKAEFIAVKKSFGNGKINNDALSAVEINCSFGCESVLRRETEGMSESKLKIAPLFIKKGYPNRKGKGKLSILKKN